MNVLANNTILLNEVDFNFARGGELTDDVWYLKQNPDIYVQHSPYDSEASYCVWEKKDDVFVEHGFFRFQGQAFSKVAELLGAA